MDWIAVPNFLAAP